MIPPDLVLADAMTKLKAAATSALAIAVVVLLIFLQRAHDSLRQARAIAAERDEQVAELRREKEQLLMQKRQPVSNEQIAELARLRREVSRLRKAAGGQAQPRRSAREAKEEVSRAPPSPAWQWPVGQFLSREQWFDAGFATPEAAVQTVFWAMATGNGPRYLDALLRQDGEPSPADAELQKVMASIAQSFESAQGATLDAAQSSSDDEVHLRLTVKKLSADTPEGVTTTPELFVLRRLGSEWKIIPGAASLLSEPAALEVEEAEEE